jgi:hypothetical protein
LVGLIALILLGSVFSLAFATGSLSSFGLGTNHTASSPGSLAKVQSGLAASDPLNGIESQQQLQSNASYWQYGGTSNQNASYYSFFEDANQLHIGVTATNSDEWTGYYAVTPPTNASLVHAILTIPANASNSGYYDIGVYMQASNQLLNYLACVGIITPSGIVWGLVHAQGSSSANEIITPLWVDSSPNQPLTRDCTVVTNGQNSASLYLDHVLVYQSDHLNLGMPAPYSFFVEDESLVSSQILYGQYQDFYATIGNNVTLTNLPSGARSAELVGQSGQVYASVPAASGKASFDLGTSDFPLSAYVQVYSSISDQSNATLVAYTPAIQQIYGGDEYSFGGHPSTSSSLNVQAEDLTGHDINGLYISLSQDRSTVSNQFMPWTFVLNNSQTYTVTAYDYGSYTFDHWSDGSTSRVLTLSITQTTNLIAYYRNVNAAPPAGKTLLSVNAVDSSGKPITGLTVSLWQNGVLQSVTYTPGSFVVTPGVLYAVAVSNYGNYTFSHWSSGVTGQFYYLGVGDQPVQLEAIFTNSTG